MPAQHCWHDFGGCAQKGNRLYGQSKCCQCGAVASWHTEHRPLPGHGPHFAPTFSVRHWEAETTVCSPTLKEEKTDAEPQDTQGMP